MRRVYLIWILMTFVAIWAVFVLVGDAVQDAEAWADIWRKFSHRR